MAESAQQGGKLNVFISYSRDDLAFADQLDAALGLAGFGATIDRQGISAGEDWQTRLGALIRDSDTVIFVLSPSSARSKTCAWEVEEAVRLGKRILPVLCRSFEGASPPPQLAKLNYIYFYDEPRFPGSGFGKGLVDLASALNTDLDCDRLSCRGRIGDRGLARRDPRRTSRRSGKGKGNGSRFGMAGENIPRRSSPSALPAAAAAATRSEMSFPGDRSETVITSPGGMRR
jgi:hypothetical protein